MRLHRRRTGKQAGYILLMLMLAVAVLCITMLGVASNYRRSVLREKEVEMIHRGVQYERAVRLFYRKNGTRYPASIEQLEDTNKVRFLRKRYKDPMTKDGSWKWAHQTDIPMLGLPGVGGVGTGLSQPGAPAADNSSDAGNAPAAEADAGNAQAGGQANGPQSGGLPIISGNPGDTGTGANSGNPTTSGQVLGGLGILGVISKSKKEGIHSFNDKGHYNEWLFVYDPTQDKGQLPNGPYNPNAAQIGSGLNSGQNGGTSQPGTGLGQTSTPTQPTQNLTQPTSPTQ